MDPPQVLLTNLNKEDSMKSKQAHVGTIGQLFTSFRELGHTSRTFTPLEKAFRTEVKDIASSYPKFWQEDFMQEGTIALHNAALKYDADPSQFYFYALKAIRLRMIDFLRSTITRSTTESVIFDIDGRSTTTRKSIFVETERISPDDGEAYNLLDHVSSPIDYVTSLSDAIDIKYHLNTVAMNKGDFSTREIKVFDLYYRDGFNVSEIAVLLNISISQTSKTIKKTELKAQHFFKEIR